MYINTNTFFRHFLSDPELTLKVKESGLYWNFNGDPPGSLSKEATVIVVIEPTLDTMKGAAMLYIPDKQAFLVMENEGFVLKNLSDIIADSHGAGFSVKQQEGGGYVFGEWPEEGEEEDEEGKVCWDEEKLVIGSTDPSKCSFLNDYYCECC